MMRLGSHLVEYLVVSVMSLVVAVLTYLLGSQANIRETNEALGMTIEIGGALAGFITVFYYSQRFIMNRHNANQSNRPESQSTKIFLTSDIGPFERQGNEYKVNCLMLNQENGDTRNRELESFWEAGHLAVILQMEEAEDYISFEVRDANEKTWEVDFFSPKDRTVELKLVN